MTPLNQVTEYLREKVRKTNLNNPKANTGAVILGLHKTYHDDMPHLVDVAFHTIQLYFTSDSSDSPAGTAKLTALSSAIGLRIYKILKREPIPWNIQVRLGDLFIEAFYAYEYVSIYYPKIRDSSHIVSATNKWVELADIPSLLERMRLTDTQFAPYSGAQIKGDDKTYLDSSIWVRSINKLQSIGWRINQRVLDSLLSHESEFISTIPIEDNDAKEQKRRSKCVEWAFIISKAKKLRDADVFYQAVEADYRGRIYYKESFLNFQGSDLARGMFKFARAKPMTEEGLWWLAVHTATSYNQSYQINEIPDWAEADYVSHLREEGLESISVDKFTLEDRVRWTNENMETLVEAGRAAMLSDAEKPVSFLACCIEWYDYDCATRDHRVHLTHLPIPVDGSNNGWQHLGAISRDSQTGELVGLTKQEIPKDFYVTTAKALHSLTTDSDLVSILEEMPMKHIRKGISKRGSMTRAYSAGAQKIGENMWFDCKTEDYHETYGITEEHCQKFAKVLIKAIDQVCPGPLTTMAYLQKLAAFEIGMRVKFTPDGEVAGSEYRKAVQKMKDLYTQKDKNDSETEALNDIVKYVRAHKSRQVYGNGADRLTWTTPSDFPVVYTCFQMESKKCLGSIYGYKRVNHVALVPTKMPDVRGFMCGVSPNFIHSLDAAHMALVVDKWNGDFGAVHDSFATHACDVDELLNLIKQEFVEMYDVLNFYDYIQYQLLTSTVDLDVSQPERGMLDVREVYNSDYFFS